MVIGFALLNFSYADEPKGKFFGAKETVYPAWFKESFLDLQEDIEEAASENKRVVLLFHQDGCPYCNALVERNLSQKDVEQKIRKNLDVIAINMWGDREVTYVDGNAYTEKTLAEVLRVQFTPTMLFFNEQGQIILRLNGYRTPQRFNVDVDFVISKMEGKVSYREYILQHLPVKKTGKQLQNEDFFQPAPFNLSQPSGLKAVFFEQKDCPNCDLLHSNVLTEPELRESIKQFHTIQLDMWADTEVITPDKQKTTAREWAKSLDVKYAPSIIIFNEAGDEVIRTEAFFKVFHNIGVFQYALSGAYKEQPSFQRYLTDYADHRREQGLDVDIWRMSGENPGERQ